MIKKLAVYLWLFFLVFGITLVKLIIPPFMKGEQIDWDRVFQIFGLEILALVAILLIVFIGAIRRDSNSAD